MDQVARDLATLLAHELSPHEGPPNLWVIDRRTGATRATSYEEEQLRAELYRQYIGAEPDADIELPPNPSIKHALSEYPEEVQEAYKAAQRQLVNVSRARKSEVEKSHERHKQMGMSMRDYLRYIWSEESETGDLSDDWYGELRLKEFQGRSTASTAEETENFKEEVRRLYAEMEQIGFDLCDLSPEGLNRSLENLYRHIEEREAPKYVKRIEEKEKREQIRRAMISKLGYLPEHVPFFDGEFYDMDVDSITTRPQIKPSIHAHHVPLTLDRCMIDTRPIDFDASEIIDGKVPMNITTPVYGMRAPTRWRIGPKLTTDFRTAGYGELFYPIRDAHKSRKKLERRNSSKTEQEMWIPEYSTDILLEA